ncbi:hypothetical protein [Laribacter hongkongensis]|uniref:hypothetical protein n=1 Tax=Laribacter hongkongensis TaxID=168471 RepID=UPI000B5A09D8|nr:hypothetical protein [Laribacter hongkongensis]MCG9110696.1 hypothetical protein [Laribacter hongkongensis]MCG9122574.1 hypothetical protein [Laribacter hongkongensis]
MSPAIGKDDLTAIEELRRFLEQLCRNHDGDGFVGQLAMSKARWISVEEFLSAADRLELRRIAFESRAGGFSAGNLKTHYVLDEDFINNGTAFVLFSLVGSDWTYVIRVNNQNNFTPVSVWLAGES